MRRAITIGFPPDDGTPVVITGPEVPHAEHKAAFKQLRTDRVHEKFDRIEIWTNSGARRVKLITSAEQAARAAAAAKGAEEAPAAPPKPAARKRAPKPSPKSKAKS